MEDADTTDIYYTYGYTVGLGLVQILRQCEGMFSRERIMREAANLRGLALPTLLPGIRVDTSPTDYRPLQQLQLIRWDGRMWQRFGPVIEASTS